MSVQRARSPFDRLRQRLEDDELRCRACGHRDPDGGWRVTAAGSRVRYEYTCPSCGAHETKTMRLGSYTDRR